MIEITDVSWMYPNAEQPSLSGLDLTVGAGEFLVLCGASGSGKSTALRLMNGLVPHFHDHGTLTGAVTVAGLSTQEATLDEIGQRTGTVLQHPRKQFFSDTVTEELAFGLENIGTPRNRIRTRVDQALAELHGTVPLDTRLSVLSGGQQQQVAIAAAGIHDPNVVLLDEPSSNLSVDAIERLHSTLQALKDRGATIVVAEHRLRYLSDLLDRVIVMAGGRIHTEWNADQFRAVTDDALADLGLRGQARDVVLPTLPASGASIRGGVPPGEVPDGALELTGITCRAGRRTILAIDKAAFPASSVTAIRGANGVGKSTLARAIAGLRRTTGAIRLNAKALPPRARQASCGLVMQDVQRQLFTESVAAELELASFGEERTDDASTLLESLDLADLRDRHPLSLSGGQQQRLVIAGARTTSRPIVIFDEPSSGVDRRHLTSISKQIRKVAATGAVVLLISHDDDLLSRAADQQITLTRPTA